MEMAIELLVTLVTFAAIMIFTYAIFKVPPMEYHKQIAMLALIVGTTNFYFKFVIDSQYFVLAQMAAWVVMMIILRGYSIMYSMIVCIIGAIFISVVDTLVTVGAMGLKLSTTDKMANNLLHFSVFHAAVSVVYLLIATILLKYKIGFSFIRRVFSGTYILKGYNFIWAAGLIIAIATLQIFANSFNAKSYNFYLIIFMTVVLIVCLYNAFVKNKQAVKSRYGDDKNRNLG